MKNDAKLTSIPPKIREFIAKTRMLGWVPIEGGYLRPPIKTSIDYYILITDDYDLIIVDGKDTKYSSPDEILKILMEEQNE